MFQYLRHTALMGLVFSLLLMACRGGKESLPPTPPDVGIANTPSLPPAVSGRNLPALLSMAPGDTVSRPMQMQQLQMKVEVTGLIAQTTLDMTFYNPLDQVLEGQFFVPLAEGQQIAAFAMEVTDGEWREAVVVPKQQARIAYESTTRRNIDPGLLEWAAGNTFKARIFPIPAGGTKRLSITIESSLSREPVGLRYSWPVATAQAPPDFKLDIRVAAPASQPRLVDGAWPSEAFTKDAEGAFTYHLQQTKAAFMPSVAFVIPREQTETQLWIERDSTGQAWFMIEAQPELYRKERPRPREIGLLWDVSHSAQKRDTATEIAFIQAYVQRLSPQAITVYPFHARALPGRRFGGTEISALVQFLRSLPLDGATDLGCLALDTAPAEAYLLFSDGLSNIGPGRLELPQTPVTVVHSSPEVDLALLDRIAALSGGHRIDLGQTDIPTAIDQLTFQPFRFLGASYMEDEIQAVFPQGPVHFDRSLLLTGKLTAATGEIALRFGYGQTITQTLRVNLDAAAAGAGAGLISRRWAQQHIAALNPDYRRYGDSIQALGQRFGIVTRETSLLVLDALEDYVRYRIMPPAPLQAEYTEAVATAERKKQVELLSHLDKVAEQWNTRKNWWEAEYEIPPGMFTPDPVKKSADMATDPVAEMDDSDGSVGSLAFEPRQRAPAQADEARDTDTKGDSGIRIKAWEPQSAYLDSLRAAVPGDWYAIYLRQKRQYGAQPGFYLDVARFFREKKASELAFRVLSNLAELGLADHELLRVLGRQLQQIGYLGEATFILESVLALRPEEPQSYRDLGLVMADREEYQAAVDYLYEVVRQPWDSRFPAIGLLCNHELNAILGRSPQPLDLEGMDARLRADLPTDLRVVLDWDTDKVDMDLWVTDPRGEKCYYAHDATAIGGQISADFTGGYGPEEFLIKAAMPGTYQVQVNYYGARTQRLTGPVHIQVRLIEDYGRPEQNSQAVTLRLARESQVLDIGEIVVK